MTSLLSAGALDARPAGVSKPLLLCFYSRTSGRCRRIEGSLAQVLQQGRNHDSFALHRIERELRPDLFARFGVGETPTFIVLQGKRIRERLERPSGSSAIRAALAPWLR